MKKYDEDKLEQLFDEARNLPLPVSTEKVRKWISQKDDSIKDDTRIFSLFPSIELPFQMPGLYQVAAGIMLMLGLGLGWLFSDLVQFGGNGQDRYLNNEVEIKDDHLSFSLIDSGKIDELSYWDTSRISNNSPEFSFENIMCFDAYSPKGGCEISLDLCLRQPGEMSLILANLQGDSLMRLFGSITQRVPDSSYKFDLCMLHSGEYQLILKTGTGGSYSRMISLN